MAVSTERLALLDRLMAAAPALVDDGLRFHNAVAQRLGLSLLDLRYLRIVVADGPITAGEVAAKTGLTSGAVTRMLDRLEKAGFVRREHDPADRRRVIISGEPDRLVEIAPMYTGMASAWRDVLDGYADPELVTILDLFERMRQVTADEIAKLA